ncbi:hypothetical protein BC937DRAFT_91898 [Endogone sp. FLAS-F59071]|nr:hypothetical protein BC937DRAFT_91898 [Endogone sp. FLAS-F59071]|eukprot:RUS15852.1 hypothetical protein BC937DRAFT_91898 [Endogone sp. FLAS-F59071]
MAASLRLFKPIDILRRFWLNLNPSNRAMMNDRLSALPPEILLQIARNLDGRDVINLSLASRYLRNLDSDELLWRYLCFKDHGVNFRDPDHSWKHLYFSCHLGEICRHLCDIDSRTTDERMERYRSVFNQEYIKCGDPECVVGMPNLWICLKEGCSSIGCGRAEGKHAKYHYQHEHHYLTLKICTLEIWCYGCRKWVGTVSSHPAERAKVSSFASLLCASVASPALDATICLNSRRQLERDLSEENARRAGYESNCFLVSSTWIYQWFGFLVGDAPAPGPVDNSDLLLDGAIDPSVICGRDFKVIGEHMWVYVLETYGIVGRTLSEADIKGEQYSLVRVTVAEWKMMMMHWAEDEDDSDVIYEETDEYDVYDDIDIELDEDDEIDIDLDEID